MVARKGGVQAAWRGPCCLSHVARALLHLARAYRALLADLPPVLADLPPVHRYGWRTQLQQ